jgi:hypothetical protein
MTIWNILTADRKFNPVALRLYFSRKRFAVEDTRLKKAALEELPATTGGAPHGGTGPVLFAVADLDYFRRFANIFASSAALASPQSAVHIHVIGADVPSQPSAFQKLPAHFSLSFETVDFTKMPGPLKGRYCQAMRFVRMAQFVKSSGRSYVAFDIDGVVQKSFANFEGEFAGDVGLILRPEFHDPGLRVNAGVVFMRATAAAQKFMDQASSQMRRHLQHAPFIEKLDQRCLAVAAATFPDVAKPLDDSIYTFEPGQGYFYSAKGKRKNETLRLVFDALIKKID